MSTDIDFVKFVKNRKHAKPEMEDLYEIDFLGRKKEGISFNDTVRNDVKKPKLAEGESSLTDFLTKNKNKIIEEPRKEKKEEKNIKEDKENSDNESDDFSEEKINHYIGREKNNIDEMQEIINEIKDRTQMIKNKRNKKEKKDKKKKKEKNKNKEEIKLNEEDSEEIEENPKKKNKDGELKEN